ncbi:hypothetical protein C8R43DRAFT_958805 [Mycena crocata]|nr:hypothetical protein C8R43DRAFT_958805 [Mycena crocata]
MPSHSITTQTRFGNAKACLTTSIATLEALSDAFKTPFLEPISKTTQLLLAAVETIKQNKADCTQLLEQTHQLLDAVLTIYIQPDAGSELPLDTLNHLGKFTETLYKILTYIQALQDRSWIKQFFRQGNARQGYRRHSLQPHKIFIQRENWLQVQTVNYVKDVADMKKHAEKKHQEVVELIEALSDTSISDEASSSTPQYKFNFYATISAKDLPWS